MRAAALAVSLALALSSLAFADPYEGDPDLASRDADYAAARTAIAKKDWAEAVRRLQQVAVREPENADVHNFLGFSYRNLKRMDLAFKHYKRSLELDPRHRGAHEYIGEAYLMVNDLPNAERHLARLRSICLLQCDELADLEKAVAAYRARQKGGKP